ncbi:hypothetical protein FOZ63_028963, partial [Perkinsus olseni]
MIDDAITVLTACIDSVMLIFNILRSLWAVLAYPITIVVSFLMVLALVAFNWYVTWTLVLRHVGPFKDFLKARAKRLAAEEAAAAEEKKKKEEEAAKHRPVRRRVRIGLFGPYIPKRHHSSSTARRRPVFLPPPMSIERPSKLPRIVARASGEVDRQQQREEEGNSSRPKQARMEDKRRREAMRKLLNSIEAACREYSRAMVHCQYRGQALRDETRKRDMLPFHLVPPSVRTGPLSLLRESVGETSNEMVKVLLVWEEENNDENGGAELEEVMGYLVLFDKTLNLLLKEVS